MSEALDLEQFFPPRPADAWADALPVDLDWQLPDRVWVRPAYVDSSRTWPRSWRHEHWDIVARSHLEHVGRTLRAGATALHIDVDRAPVDFEALVRLDVPLMLSGATVDHVDLMTEAASRLGMDRAQLRGAVWHPTADLVAATRGTGLRAIRLRSRPGTVVQELAGLLHAMVSACDQYSVEAVARSALFWITVGEQYLVEIARLRALRHLGNLVFAAYEVEAPPITIACEPSADRFNFMDPDTHLARQSMQHMAAVVGGCNYVFAGRHPRILRILRHEAGLPHTPDPGAGSWYIEALTEALAERAWERFGAPGGMPALTADREKFQKERAQAIRTGRTCVVGGNAYTARRVPDSLRYMDQSSLVRDFGKLRVNAPVKTVEVLTSGADRAEHVAWARRVIRLAGFQERASAADVTIRFDTECIGSARNEVLVLGQRSSSPSSRPVLVVGQDLVEAAKTLQHAAGL